ncbi:HFX_2341 family transcriptional regulator domain-containing protein [Methanogenium cariaci]|jgi:uncharacterized protein DUF6293
MKNDLGKTIHIVPLGHERERAVVPFHDRTADLVYLVVNEGSPDSNSEVDSMQLEQEYYTQMVVNDLKKLHIDVKIVTTDTFNFAPLINTFSKLILMEKKNNSNIFINMSSSGRFASVAASIAGMAHDVSVYYVHSKKFSKTDKEFKEHGVCICPHDSSWVEELSNYRFELPTETEVCILELLYAKSLTSYRWATTKELCDLLHEKYPDDYDELPVFRDMDTKDFPKEKIERLRKLQSKLLTKLNGSLMRKLIAKNYVIRNDPTETSVRYTITSSGEYALHLSDFGEELDIEEYVKPASLKSP